MSKLESRFQADLKKRLRERYPGCIVMKNDPNDTQGIPDLMVLHRNKWAALECKKDAKSTHRPNQDYYVDKMNSMSFSRFVYPENLETVLTDLDIFFGGVENEDF